MFGTLLAWGWIALGWTVFTTTNSTRGAIEAAKRPILTAHYSLPLGSQWSYPVNITFPGGFCGSSPTYATCSASTPVSNSSTTIEDYVTFDVSIPNGTAIKIWSTGPKGNMTFDCGSGIMYSSCYIEPNPPGGGGIGPIGLYYPVLTPGNYTIHVLSEQCMPPSGPISNCTTNTAIGTVTPGLSTIRYNRPYWAWGYATVIAAIIGIIGTTIVAGIIAYRNGKRRGAVNTPRKGRPPGEGVD